VARESGEPLDQGKALNAVLALLVAQRQERNGTNGAEPRKTEMILASAGLNATEIAPLVGKKYDAVVKAIQRGRQPGQKRKKKS
jgi:DNA-directed RNA polymerase specialized sigma24 family protein